MNKVAVISGGSKGIGRAIAIKLASENFDIITCARNAADLEQLSAELKASFPACACHFKAVDLSKKSEVISFIDFINSKTAHVDILVNNTGVFLPGSIHDEPEDQLELQINTNLYSAYHLTRGLIANMMAKKKGHVFNMCSVASITAYPNGGSYCISKFALYGMSQVLREEMKPHGVRVTALLPGATFTDSWSEAGIEESRFMKVEDVADALWAAYQLSDHSVIEEMVIRPQLGDI